MHRDGWMDGQSCDQQILGELSEFTLSLVEIGFCYNIIPKVFTFYILIYPYRIFLKVTTLQILSS